MHEAVSNIVPGACIVASSPLPVHLSRSQTVKASRIRQRLEAQQPGRILDVVKQVLVDVVLEDCKLEKPSLR